MEALYTISLLRLRVMHNTLQLSFFLFLFPFLASAFDRLTKVIFKVCSIPALSACDLDRG